MALNLPERPCEFCQELYKPKRAKQRFCKKKCRHAAHNDKKIALSDTCPHCGKPITTDRNGTAPET